MGKNIGDIWLVRMKNVYEGCLRTSIDECNKKDVGFEEWIATHSEIVVFEYHLTKSVYGWNVLDCIGADD